MVGLSITDLLRIVRLRIAPQGRISWWRTELRSSASMQIFKYSKKSFKLSPSAFMNYLQFYISSCPLLDPTRPLYITKHQKSLVFLLFSSKLDLECPQCQIIDVICAIIVFTADEFQQNMLIKSNKIELSISFRMNNRTLIPQGSVASSRRCLIEPEILCLSLRDTVRYCEILWWDTVPVTEQML